MTRPIRKYKPDWERPSQAQKDKTEMFVQQMAAKHVADDEMRARLFPPIRKEKA